MTRILSPYEIKHLRRFNKEELVAQDLNNTPVEYLTGKVEFGGLVFGVTQDTLIPRVETEELIPIALGNLEGNSPDLKQVTIADVGCGCGALGISVAYQLLQKFPRSQINLTLSDISPEALNVTKLNANELLPTEIKTKFLVSDLLTQFPKEKFDLLMANLPYIPHERIAHLPASVVDFEPHLALDGGPVGTQIIRRFIKQTPSFLKTTGKIILEIDEEQTAEELIPKEVTYDFRVIKDQFGKNRFLLLSNS